MSLPSRYAPSGLSKEDEKKTITVGTSVGIRQSSNEDRSSRGGVNEDIQLPEDVKSEYVDLTDDDIEMLVEESTNNVNEILNFAGQQDYSKHEDDMEVVDNSEGPWSEKPSYIRNEVALLVIDTNFILAHLDIIHTLHGLASRYGLRIIIPISLVRELDLLKSSTKITTEMTSTNKSEKTVGYLARKAIDWVYTVLANNSSFVKGQKVRQSLNKDAIKDDAFLDCCIYFKENYPNSLVVLLSDDKNLCLKALTNEILTISYRENMTAELIAKSIEEEFLRRSRERQGIVFEGLNPDLPKGVNNCMVPNQDDCQSYSTEAHRIFEEIQTLMISIVRHCMLSNYGSDLDLVRNYNSESIHSLADCTNVIIEFWIPVFSLYFSKSKSIKPFSETTYHAKKSRRLPIFVDLPENSISLRRFVEFWSEILAILYEGELNEQQNEALEQLICHWKKLVDNLQTRNRYGTSE